MLFAHSSLFLQAVVIEHDRCGVIMLIIDISE